MSKRIQGMMLGELAHNLVSVKTFLTRIRLLTAEGGDGRETILEGPSCLCVYSVFTLLFLGESPGS